jgi:hypothetical protein
MKPLLVSPLGWKMGELMMQMKMVVKPKFLKTKAKNKICQMVIKFSIWEAEISRY